MKKIMMCFILLGLFSCKKEEPAPATPPVTNSMNPTEQGLVKDWFVKRQENYYNDTLIASQNNTNKTQCHLDLKTDAHSNGAGYICIFGITCAPSTLWWKAQPGSLFLGSSTYGIIHHSQDSLVIEQGGISKVRYILIK